MTNLAKEVVSAKLIALTQPVAGLPISGPEGLIAYCARVSSSRDKEERGEDYEGLLRYCIKHKHWSIFQMVNALVEVKSPRDISRQFVRHESLYLVDDEVITVPGFDRRFGGVQEFSQRYSDDIEFCNREYRKQDYKNRQNSTDTLGSTVLEACHSVENASLYSTQDAYRYLLFKGVAKECARVILPEGLTMSTLYVNGTLRSWLHYLEVRDDPGCSQWEHVQLARAIKEALLPAFPSVFGAVTDANS